MRGLAAVSLIAICACGMEPSRAADAPKAGAQAPVATPALVVPSLDFKPTSRDIRHYDDYFYFHKPGIDYATALGDIAECDAYSREIAPMASIPAFVPWGGRPAPDPTIETALVNAWFNWGLVGLGIVAVVEEDLRSGVEHANMRRCMGFKGYRRYGTSSAIWSQLESGTRFDREARLATIASGPAPQSEAIAP